VKPVKPVVERVLNLAPKQFDVYCDESCTQGGDRFMVYGGLVFPTRKMERFDNLMKQWRIKHRVDADSELGWESVAKHRLAIYQSLIDLYKSNRWRDGFLNFKAMVVDKQSPDYVAFMKRNQKISDDLGYYKLYEVFLRHKAGAYVKDNDYSLNVYLDDRSTNYPLENLRTFLNLKLRKQPPFFDRDVVEIVATRLSHQTEALQLADVLMGAIGWAMNEKDKRPNANPAKTQLAIHLASRLQIPSRSLKDRVPSWRDPLFDVWKFKFNEDWQRPDSSMF